MKKIVIALSLLAAPALAQQQMPQMPDLDQIFFKQFDTNQDGQVSREEFLKPTEAQFDYMDRNKDGALDQAEVKAFNEEMKQRMEEIRKQMQQQGGVQGMPGR